MRTRWAERATDALTAWVDLLPPRLRRLLPRELVGFAILGGFTLGVDLALLAALRHATRLPLPVAVSIAYVAAFGLNFVLNRTINFRSHAPVGGQVARYAVVVAGDYLLTVGVTTGLSAFGLDFRVARLTASFCVAMFTYIASRRWVFGEPRPAGRFTTVQAPCAHLSRSGEPCDAEVAVTRSGRARPTSSRDPR